MKTLIDIRKDLLSYKLNGRFKALIKKAIKLEAGKYIIVGEKVLSGKVKGVKSKPYDLQDLVHDYIIYLLTVNERAKRNKHHDRLLNNLEKEVTEKEYRNSLYMSFKDYVVSKYKKFNNRRKLEREEMFELQPTQSYIVTLSNVFKHFNEEQAIIACWRIGMIKEEKACEELGCTTSTLYRKFNKFKKEWRAE